MKKILSFTDFLKEDRSQLNIPFKEKEYSKKTLHEDLVDALEKLNIRGEKYYSTGNPSDELAKVTKKAMNKMLEEANNDESAVIDYLTRFFERYSIEEYSEYYNKKELVKIEKEEEEGILEDPLKLAEAVNNNYDYKTFFSKEGLKQFLDETHEHFLYDIEDMQYTVEKCYEKNDGGLIDIWRTIEYDEDVDNYVKIIEGYGGVGVYWTWDKDSAQAYWGPGGRSITLHGKVSVENVDWLLTAEASAYYLKEEKELRVKDGGKVLIVGFTDDKLDKYYETGPFLVHSSSSRKERKKSEKKNTKKQMKNYVVLQESKQDESYDYKGYRVVLTKNERFKDAYNCRVLLDGKYKMGLKGPVSLEKGKEAAEMFIDGQNEKN